MKYLETDKDVLDCPECEQSFWVLDAKEKVEIDEDFQKVRNFYGFFNHLH